MTPAPAPAGSTRLGLALASIDVEEAAHNVKTYLTEFDGGSFETYGDNPLSEITGDDLVAVTMLSMEIRRGSRSGISTHAARRLEVHRRRVAALLREVPPRKTVQHLDATEFAQHLGSDSAAARLWRLLRSDDIGLPRVATAKLLARKRPHLLPVYDSVAARTAGRRSSEGWWELWWQTFQAQPALVEHLSDVRAASGTAAAHLGLLRTADIMIWMKHRPNGSGE